MTTSSDGLTAPFALARFRIGAEGDPRVGIVAEGRIVPVPEEWLDGLGINGFLADPGLWVKARSLASQAETDPAALSLEDVVLTSPVEPRQVLQTGANYRAHVIDLAVSHRAPDDPRTEAEAREQVGRMMDERARNGVPYFFIGLPASVVGDDQPLALPAYSDRHDWELELAVVIGTRAFRVDPAEALEHVAGYTIANDVTTRNLVFRADMKEIGTDWFRAKNAPGFTPTGPFIIPAEFVGDPGALRLRLEVNGEVMQDATTDDLLFDVPALISAASQIVPLLPGDLLLTGSPAGNGQARGVFLRAGDVMVGAITGLGTQIVTAIDESVSSVEGMPA